MIASPGLTARVCASGMLPAAAAKIFVFAIWITPCPLPFCDVLNIPGETAARVTVCRALIWPPTVTTTEAEVPVSSGGIWTLSWPGNEENTGAAMPLKVTLAPPRVVSSLPSLPKDEYALLDPSFKLLPKMAAMVPGAIGFAPVAKLALLTTLSAGTTGAVAASTNGLQACRDKQMQKRRSFLRIDVLILL